MTEASNSVSGLISKVFIKSAHNGSKMDERQVSKSMREDSSSSGALSEVFIKFAHNASEMDER